MVIITRTCRRLFHRCLKALFIAISLQPRNFHVFITAMYLQFIYRYNMYMYVVVYIVHVISQNIDGGATKADQCSSGLQWAPV